MISGRRSKVREVARKKDDRWSVFVLQLRRTDLQEGRMRKEEGRGDLGRTRRGGRMRQWRVLVLLLRS